MRFFVIVLGVVCALLAAAGVMIIRSGSISSALHGTSVTPSPSGAALPGSGSHAPGSALAGGSGLQEVGVVTNSLKNFQRATSAYPGITVHYLAWGSPFPSATILGDRRLGARALIILEPERVSLPGIAAGREDGYLKEFAAAQRKLGLPILLSFGPEANGSWYSWGAHHITPTLYIEMWRHVHDVILKNGGSKITWLWQMNTPWPYSEPMNLLWPGSKYIDEVGIDGQMTSPSDTFSSVFGPSITQIRSITNEPILVSEVSVKVGPAMPREITSLFTGACREGLKGVILFDIHTNWQFDHNAQAVAAFKQAATTGCKA